ncbi:MAG: hypothetical protein M3410_03175 [Acidobacteriota bacterium]|nr:hypothetical protein [Acidobacteriota bacterium]
MKAGRKFELLATNPMGQAMMATPAISDGLLILRTDNYIYAIRERKAARRVSTTGHSGIQKRS